MPVKFNPVCKDWQLLLCAQVIQYRHLYSDEDDLFNLCNNGTLPMRLSLQLSGWQNSKLANIQICRMTAWFVNAHIFNAFARLLPKCLLNFQRLGLVG